jgi:hypothetical protein
MRASCRSKIAEKAFASANGALRVPEELLFVVDKKHNHFIAFEVGKI